ncbi:23072_t:CDS:1, partial [Racocetra persica]
YPQTVDFQYLSCFCIANIFTSSLQKPVSKKTHWFKEYEIAKKALDLTIQLNCDDEFFGMIEEFISSKTHELQYLEENRNA